MTRIKKFKAIIDKYPEQRINILMDLSDSYLKLGNIQKSIYYYLKAFTSNPFSISLKRDLKLYLKSIAVFIFKY